LVEPDRVEARLTSAVPAAVEALHGGLNLGKRQTGAREALSDYGGVLWNVLIGLGGMEPDREHRDLLDVGPPQVLKLIPQVKPLDRLQ
jgi:hypothetical protein